jgi:putative transcriptional regulator
MKLARIENDLTQQELADIVGVTRQTIGLIEKGDFNPSLRICIAIALALNRTLDDLFWIEEDDYDKG